MSKRKRSQEGQGEAMPLDARDTAPTNDDRDRVARRAYELYIERGCGDGRAEDDWLCAERELRNGGRTNGEP
jgi:hypothetical protein